MMRFFKPKATVEELEELRDIVADYRRDFRELEELVEALKPEIPEPPAEEPPSSNWPDWALSFGDLDRYESRWAPNNRKAFYRVKSIKAAVFFPDTYQSYAVKRPDGSTAWKHVFVAREFEGHPLTTVPQGALFPGYAKVVPAGTAAWSKAYADGGSVIEGCDPSGGVYHPEDVEMIAYIDPDGNYVSLE